MLAWAKKRHVDGTFFEWKLVRTQLKNLLFRSNQRTESTKKQPPPHKQFKYSMLGTMQYVIILIILNSLLVKGHPEQSIKYPNIVEWSTLNVKTAGYHLRGGNTNKYTWTQNVSWAPPRSACVPFRVKASLIPFWFLPLRVCSLFSRKTVQAGFPRSTFLGTHPTNFWEVYGTLSDAFLKKTQSDDRQNDLHQEAGPYDFRWQIDRSEWLSWG